LRHKKQGKNTDWVLLGYEPDLKFLSSGTFELNLNLTTKGSGGFEEAAKNFTEENIRYAVVEVVVTGDDYNPVKHVLVTWIGPKVPPGIFVISFLNIRSSKSQMCWRSTRTTRFCEGLYLFVFNFSSKKLELQQNFNL
jgi:hypothetical protein